MVEKLVVTISGVLLIVLVNWYFFFSKRKSIKDQQK
jgi:plastocyanin domain-containing protein